MGSTLHQLFAAGLATSAKESYQSGSNRYIRFCSLYNLPPFPTCERSLSLFVAYLYQEGLSASTVKGYLSAVRYSQISLGFGDPKIGEMPQLEYVTKGMRKLSSTPSRSHLPVTLAILRFMRSSWVVSPVPKDAIMLWAAACMCFFGFLRAGEIVVPSDAAYDASCHLSMGDVRVDSTVAPLFLEVTLKASKTDPFRTWYPCIWVVPILTYVQWQLFLGIWSLVGQLLARFSSSTMVVI